jgi:putative flippase GtrA
VGGIATVADWGLFYLCEAVVKIHYLLALVMAFIAGIIVNFILSKIWVFNSKRYQLKKEFIFFTIIGLLGLIFSILMMKSMIEFLNILPMIARMLTTFLVLIWNFAARKYLLF